MENFSPGRGVRRDLSNMPSCDSGRMECRFLDDGAAANVLQLSSRRAGSGQSIAKQLQGFCH
ncbi:hypothetical protein D3C86_935040 [compost metagenome]